MKRAGESKQPLECCRSWLELGCVERAQWPWQVVHRFSHSRVTFSLPTLAEAARVAEVEAADLVKGAEGMKWIWTPYEGLWVGRLTASRR